MAESPTNLIHHIARTHPEFFEHEQKFRLQMKNEEALRALETQLKESDATISHITQGYISDAAISKVRMRLVRDENGKVQKGFITLKGPPLQKPGERKKRLELEIPIPADQLQAYQDVFPAICPVTLEKTRYSLEMGEHKFDVDRYHWSGIAQDAMAQSPVLSKHYDHLATLDVEFKKHDNNAILTNKNDFPELLRPFLALPGNNKKPQEITHCSSYKSAALAALNTTGNESKTMKCLLSKIKDDLRAEQLSSPEAKSTGR